MEIFCTEKLNSVPIVWCSFFLSLYLNLFFFVLCLCMYMWTSSPLSVSFVSCVCRRCIFWCAYICAGWLAGKTNQHLTQTQRHIPNQSLSVSHRHATHGHNTQTPRRTYLDERKRCIHATKSSHTSHRQHIHTRIVHCLCSVWFSSV